MLITAEYADQNRQLHILREDYGSKVRPKRIEAIEEWKKKLGANTILDYGCGKGVLSTYIPDIRNYDPAIYEFSALPSPADLVVCMDVLEHVEPECLNDVLDHLQSLALKGVFLIISTRPETAKTLPDGRNPHLIVETAEWWLEKLRARWKLVDGWFTERDLYVRAVPYYAQPVDYEAQSEIADFALHKQHHATVSHYGISGHRWAPFADKIAKQVKARTVLDYGCGKGGMKGKLPTLKVYEYDPGIPGKDTPPEPADLVVCADVLVFCAERLPRVIDDLVRCSKKALLIVIPFHPPEKIEPSLPYIYKPLEWWLRQFDEKWPTGTSWDFKYQKRGAARLYFTWKQQ